MQETSERADILEHIKGKLSLSDDYLTGRVEGLKGLFDDEGLTDFFSLLDFIAGFDESTARWLLKTDAEIFKNIKRSETRRKVIREITGMGRSKWSVAIKALMSLGHAANIPDGMIVNWLMHGNSLADVDQDVALAYFDVSPSVFEVLGEELFNLWATMAGEIAGMTWKAAKEYLRASPEVVKKIDHCDLERWARLGMYLIGKSPRVKASYNAHSMLAQGTMAGKSKLIDLAVQYFKSAPQILSRLTINDLEDWVEKGLEFVEKDSEKGTAFFSLRSGNSRTTMEKLIKGLELKDVYIILVKFASALIDRKVQIRSSAVFYKNLPGLSRFFSVTDGMRIFLPSKVAVFEDQELNFKTFKCSLAHELAHIVFDTFSLPTEELKRMSELRNPVQALKIFEFLEDERVDYLMGLQYPGLERDRRMILEAYATKHSNNGGDSSCVFAHIPLEGYKTAGKDLGNESRLTSMLKEALWVIKDPGMSAMDTVDLTIKICNALSETPFIELCECREAYERAFYRGIIDFKLIEESMTGTSKLVIEMLERFDDEKKNELGAGLIEEAIYRIEESEGLESEELLWQITEAKRLDELFETVKSVVTEIEEERRFRRSVHYDEWDMKLDDYKKEWCRVREIEMPSTTLLFYNKTINEYYGIVSLLKRHFGLLRPDRFRRFFKEERGDDLDLDAVIESVVDRHAGITPSDRVYIRRDKKLRDVSVVFLVDMSYSTGDMLPSGKRIIDIEREGMILMAEALESIGDRWAVYGFSTSKRDKVDFYVIRDFDEPFSDEVKMRYEGIRPMAQTRLGAAIRHASSFLVKQPSQIRLLILLSDGRPYDIDYGDAVYAIEDTRMALWEGRSRGVNSFCITVDKKSRDYLPHMYGESKYTIIDNIEALPVSLPLIYKKLTT